MAFAPMRRLAGVASALLEDIVKAEGSGPLVLGVGALMLAPAVLPALGRMLRPVLKGAIKTGITVYEEAYASVMEATGDIIAEARAEFEQEHGGEPVHKAATRRMINPPTIRKPPSAPAVVLSLMAKEFKGSMK
jgi:hypothetical protein